MQEKRGEIRGEPLIQRKFGQALLFADVQPLEAVPAGAEIEITLLPGPVLLVEYNFTLVAAGRDGRAIDAGRRTCQARRDWPVHVRPTRLAPAK